VKALPADPLAALAVVREQRWPAVLITVVESVGSAPQVPGARMLLLADGRAAGTVGGGAFEHAALQRAQELLASGGRSELWRANLTSLGMCCGGVMTVFLERVPLADRLVLLGAGHIAAPLSAMGARAGFEVVVVDERAELTTAGRFPDARTVLCDDPEAALGELPGDAHTAFVIATHDHRLDQALVKALVLSAQGFVGLVGSEAKRSKFVMRLSAQGVPAEKLARLRSPVGVEIGAVTPEEIAVAILAELVAWRRGVAIGEGVPVRAKRRAAE
jgi:xanthine dehydrogenase accessory factor